MITSSLVGVYCWSWASLALNVWCGLKQFTLHWWIYSLLNFFANCFWLKISSGRVSVQFGIWSYVDGLVKYYSLTLGYWCLCKLQLIYHSLSLLHVVGDNHSIMIYYPSSAGGGMKELFRKVTSYILQCLGWLEKLICWNEKKTLNMNSGWQSLKWVPSGG